MNFYELDERAKARQGEIDQWIARRRLISQAAPSPDRDTRGLRSRVLILAASISVTATYLLLGW